jgi:hypothetical protein
VQQRAQYAIGVIAPAQGYELVVVLAPGEVVGKDAPTFETQSGPLEKLSGFKALDTHFALRRTHSWTKIFSGIVALYRFGYESFIRMLGHFKNGRTCCNLREVGRQRIVY